MSRTPFVPAELLSKLWRAVIEFDMLQAGDRILIGLSGGKDSTALLCALANLRNYYPKKFTLYGLTLSMGFEGMDFSQTAELCRRLGVQHCICSVVDRQTLTVEYINFSANKVSAFRKCFGASAVPDAFYTDNAADLPMIHLSRTAYKVRRNRITQIK